MTAALRLVDLAMSMAPTVAPSPMSTSVRPTASMCPTMVPGSRATVAPSSRCTTIRPTEAPSTQRSATVFPRFDGATRQEARKLLASLRSNVHFLESAIGAVASPVALVALADIVHDIDHLEARIALAPSTPSLLVRHG